MVSRWLKPVRMCNVAMLSLVVISILSKYLAPAVKQQWLLINWHAFSTLTIMVFKMLQAHKLKIFLAISILVACLVENKPPLNDLWRKLSLVLAIWVWLIL